MIIAAPDIRPEDLPVKATILTISISRTLDAIWSFACGLECDTGLPAYECFCKQLDNVVLEAKEASRELLTGALPFDLRDSTLARDWAKLKSRGA